MKTIICPTVMAYDKHGYREQMERVQPFARRVHIDLMDGHFAPFKSPDIADIWWPEGVMADIHLMYRDPLPHLPALIELRPHLVIVHAEAEGDHAVIADNLHQAGIKAGIALLHDTAVEQIGQIVKNFDHVVVFGGQLGRHGGQADMSVLDKVSRIRQLAPQIEIAWDGGINDANAKQIAAAGTDVLDVGGFIQSAEDPSHAYAKLKTIAENI